MICGKLQNISFKINVILRTKRVVNKVEFFLIFLIIIKKQSNSWLSDCFSLSKSSVPQIREPKP